MTMFSSVISGDDWQKFIVRLLYVRYGADLIEVPDQHKGDHGIEAFTTDGCVYQCYAPEGDVGPAILADRHKVKITNDLAKFRKNEFELAKIFGNTKILRWLLVVPDHCSSDVVAHCEKKAQELLEMAQPLSFISPDFKVITVNGYDFFALQISQLEQHGGLLVEASQTDLQPGEVESFEEANGEWLANLDRKLLALPRLPTGPARAAFRERLLRYYLEGSNAITYYDQRFPLISEKVRSLKEAESRSLEVESIMKDLTITSTRERFQQKMSEAIPSLGRATSDVLSYAAIVEWLMLCPLDPTG
jgi:hypothetical protein